MALDTAPELDAKMTKLEDRIGDMSRAYRIVSRVDLSVLRDPYTLATKSAVKFHAR